jgi:hypothetical protein
MVAAASIAVNHREKPPCIEQSSRIEWRRLNDGPRLIQQGLRFGVLAGVLYPHRGMIGGERHTMDTTFPRRHAS